MATHHRRTRRPNINADESSSSSTDDEAGNFSTASTSDQSHTASYSTSKCNIMMFNIFIERHLQ